MIISAGPGAGHGAVVVRDHGAQRPDSGPLSAVAPGHKRDGVAIVTVVVVVLRDDLNVATETTLVVDLGGRAAGGRAGGGAGVSAAREDREPKVRRVERHLSEGGALSEQF